MPHCHCHNTTVILCRTLICTEQCLLHPSRNPALDKEGIEAQLKEFLGIEKIIWLWRGMAGDEVFFNGHVDSLACFVRPGVVLLSWTDDVNDPQVGCSLCPLKAVAVTSWIPDVLYINLIQIFQVSCRYIYHFMYLCTGTYVHVCVGRTHCEFCPLGCCCYPGLMLTLADRFVAVLCMSTADMQCELAAIHCSTIRKCCASKGISHIA